MKKIFVPAMAAMFLAACSSNYQKTASGLLYKIVSRGSGPQVKKGEFMKVNFTESINDSMVLSSYDNGMAVYPKVDSVGAIYNVLEILPKLHKGDSVVIVEIGDSLEKRGMLPPMMKHTDKRKWTMKVENIFTDVQVMQKDLAADLQKMQDKQKTVFENFVAKKPNLQKTSDGVYVDVKSQGNGAAVDTGKVIAVRYTGKLIPSEKVFQSNMDDPNTPPLDVTLGTGSVIRGWETALKMFHVGGKGTLYIPYQLAYNDQPGPGGIPYENLIFDIEVLGIKDAPPQPRQPSMQEMQEQMQQQQMQQQQAQKKAADTIKKKK
jgi:FKBP-type peptidyl-prolyl cis-trans isomerase